MLALFLTYIIALGLTPALTYVLVESVTGPLDIFKCVLLLVAILLPIDIPLKHVMVLPKAKIIITNFVMFLLLVLSLGHNRDFVPESSGLTTTIYLILLSLEFSLLCVPCIVAEAICSQ